MAYGGTTKGAVLPNFDNYGQGNANSNLGQPIRSAYDAGATTQAEDYDKIMGNYDSLLSSAKNRQNSTPLNYTPVSASYQTYQPNFQYNRSSGLNNAITGLEDYAKTGGYSEGDLGNIRERSISPIRSIYSSAQDNLRRQKVLQGGYSPNFGAASAKMARDSSSQIGDITTKVNAEIAQMVAEGKLKGYQSLSPLVANENTMMNDFGARNEQGKVDMERFNVDETNKVNEMNSTGVNRVNELNNANQNQAYEDQLRAVQGMTSLYGTTPALTATFGNQVLQNNAQQIQAASLANSIKNQRANVGLNLVQNQLTPNISGISAGEAVMSFVSRLRMANMFPINSDLGTATVDDSGDEMNDVINAGKALFQYNRMFQNDRPLGMQRVAQSAAPSGVIGNPNMPADPRVTELSPQLRFGGVIGGQNDPGAQMNAQAGQDVRKIYDSYNQPAITAGEILGKAGIKQNDQDPGMTAAIKDLDPDQELNREVKRQTIRNGQATVESKGWHTVNVTDPNDATKTIAVQVQDGTGAVKPVDIPGTITSKASPAALEKMASERASLAESQENIRTQATDALALLDQLLDPKTNELTNEAQWATGGSAILGKIPLPTAAYAGASKLDRLAKIQVLSLIEEMKKQSASGSVGMGNMSNSDRAVLENASSLLGRPGLDEDTIKQELIKVKGILQKAQRGGAPPLATSHGQPNATLEPGKIRVRNRITGETGTMSQGAFNPSKYERIQ